jgi:hypothetical protein
MLRIHQKLQTSNCIASLTRACSALTEVSDRPVAFETQQECREVFFATVTWERTIGLPPEHEQRKCEIADSVELSTTREATSCAATR